MVEPAGDDILNQCAAIVFAAGPHGSETLIETARQIGFGHVEDYTRLSRVPQDLLAFYFVHGALPDGAKLRLVRSIRSSTEDRRKYAPIVCVLTGGPRHLIVPHVEMGFDEVLFLTDPQASLVQKLRAQLQQDVLFVETHNYMGPDRRRIEVVDRGDPRRKVSGPAGIFRKIKVWREPASGVSATFIS